MAQDPKTTQSQNPSQLLNDASALQENEAGITYGDYVIPAEEINNVWESEDPQSAVKTLFLKWVEDEGERKNVNLQTWNEYENRFQNAELIWLSDFIVQNLCHCKRINLSTDQGCAALMHFLWQCLDVLNDEDLGSEIAAQLQSRYQKLQTGLKTLFADKIINKEQVAKTLEYARMSIFGHLQLYISCISMKKQKTVVKKIRIFHEQPRIHEQHGLEADCKEIQTDQPVQEEEQKEGDENEEVGEVEGEGEAQEEFFDADDPLYGLEQRLENLALDDESKKVIKEKLIDAHGKIKTQLETRQANLDAKLVAAQGAKKK